MPALRVLTELTGANDSRQYSAVVGYTSLLRAQEETIKVEVGLREPLLTPAIRGEARTLLLDPVSRAPMALDVRVRCVSRAEAMAEKARAALSRREVAIRDFYDIDHAVRRLGFRVDDPELLRLLRQKLAVPENEAVDVSNARLASLTRPSSRSASATLRTKSATSLSGASTSSRTVW